VSTSTEPNKAESVAAEPMEGLPNPRRRWAAMTLLVGIGMSVLDSSMSNVALPTIARELNQSAAAVVWIVNAYGLTLVMTLLPMSAIGERTGFKRLFKYGLLGLVLLIDTKLLSFNCFCVSLY